MCEPQGMKTPLLTTEANENFQQIEILMGFKDFQEAVNTKEKRRSDPHLQPIMAQQVHPISNGCVEKPSAQSASIANTNSLKPSKMTSRVHALPAQISLSPQPITLAPAISSNTTLNGTSSAIFCRICYSNESKEHLMNWCNCSGTMGLMHKSCLERWLSQSNSNNCEICKYEFKVDKTPRSFKQWLCRPISFRENKNLLNDLVCFLILTPLACISTWYCVLFALKFHETENRWEASGLVVLTSFLLFIYVLWFSFSCKYHYKVFREWQKKNQIVTIKMNEDRVVINVHRGPPEVRDQILNISRGNDHLLNFDDDSITTTATNPDFQTSSISIDENAVGAPTSIHLGRLKRQSTMNIEAHVQSTSSGYSKSSMNPVQV